MVSNNKFPDYLLEESAIKKGFKHVAGADEAGYGPGAGPVVAAAVRIPQQHVETLLQSGRIKDSKKLSEKRRKEA